MSTKKDKIDKIKIATLNVEGFDEEDCMETLNRLNRRKLDIINLQNINLNKPNIDFAKEHLWKYDSIWTSNTAILAGNENIQFDDTEELENGITTIVKYHKMNLSITNIYISSCRDGLNLKSQWMPFKIENKINIIVGEFEEISLPTIYDEEMSGFTNVVDILGKQFIQGAQDNRFPDCIYIDNDYTHFCKKIEVFYDEFSNPLVVCTLECFIWKLRKQLLEDPDVVEDVTKEIISVDTVYEWDRLKNHFQSLFRSYKLNSIFKEPKKELISFDDIDSSYGDFDSLDPTVQENLIKGGWAEKNENATSVVRDPSAPDSTDPTEILIYIRNYYQDLFKEDTIKDLKIATEITDDLPHVSAFADDLTIGLGCTNDWYLVSQLLSKYERASNAEVNKKKSILVALTDEASRTKLAGGENYQMLTGTDTTKYLGFSIDKKGQLEENFWDKMIKNIKKTMQDIDRNELSSEDKMLGRIWLKLLTSNDLWAKMERELIEKNLNEPIITALQQPAKLNNWPSEWLPYFKAWKRLNGKVLSTDSWPWNIDSIEIANHNSDKYSIKSAIKYLENDNM
ncbi:7981_t:CDS:2 [Gigaspora rosea]|nr:7981_t:CDS:2 [Gigaspora rosea]